MYAGFIFNHLSSTINSKSLVLLSLPDLLQWFTTGPALSPFARKTSYLRLRFTGNANLRLPFINLRMAPLTLADNPGGRDGRHGIIGTR
jgi:hypothetical protein